MTQRQLAWRTDSSNSEAKYKRNRVRLQLVPLLEVREESEKKIKKKRNRVRNRVCSWLRC
jgi:tRNA(Ile)-lysidine synthase TilS/MesJ